MILIFCWCHNNAVNTNHIYIYTCTYIWTFLCFGQMKNLYVIYLIFCWHLYWNIKSFASLYNNFHAETFIYIIYVHVYQIVKRIIWVVNINLIIYCMCIPNFWLTSKNHRYIAKGSVGLVKILLFFLPGYAKSLQLDKKITLSFFMTKFEIFTCHLTCFLVSLIFFFT